MHGRFFSAALLLITTLLTIGCNRDNGSPNAGQSPAQPTAKQTREVQAFETWKKRTETEAVLAVALSHDQRNLATLSADRKVRIRDLKGGQSTVVTTVAEKLDIESKPTYQLRFAGTGQDLILGANRTLYLLKEGAVPAAIPLPNRVNDLLVTNPGTFVVATAKGVSYYSKGALKTLVDTQVLFGADHNHLYWIEPSRRIGATWDNGGETQIGVWEVGTWKQVYNQKVPTYDKWDTSISMLRPDRSIFTARNYSGMRRINDGATKEWDLERRKELGGAYQPLFDPSGRYFILAFYSGLQVVDLETQKTAWTAKPSDSCVSIGFSPDGTKLLTGSWLGTVSMYELATGELIQTLER